MKTRRGFLGLLASVPVALFTAFRPKPKKPTSATISIENETGQFVTIGELKPLDDAALRQVTRRMNEQLEDGLMRDTLEMSFRFLP